MTRTSAPVLLACAAAAWFAPGCSFEPDLRTTAGRGTDVAQRDCYVASRARAPVESLPLDVPATLVDLLALVDAGSVSVQEARARAAAAEAAVAQARSAMLPDLNLGGTLLSHAKAPNQGGFTTDRHVAEGLIELSAPLDVSGTLAESVRAAQARYRSDEQRLRAVLREEQLLAAQSYFNLLSALDLAEVNRATVALQVRALEDGRARLAAGVLRKNDVLVLEVGLSNSRQRSVALESAVLEARRALNVTVGLPVDHPTEVAPFDGVIPVAADVTGILERARHDNPDVDVLIETRSALLHDLQANVRSEAPDVRIGPRLTGTTEQGLDTGAFLGFMSVTWNPDLSGRIYAERQGIRARLLELAWSVTGLLRRIEQRILLSHQTTIERTSALLAAETSAGQALENNRITLEQFRAGTSTGREVLEAQATLAQQDGTARTSRHGVNAAQFELWYLAGVEPLEYARRVSAETRPSPESR